MMLPPCHAERHYDAAAALMPPPLCADIFERHAAAAADVCSMPSGYDTISPLICRLHAMPLLCLMSLMLLS